MPSVTTPHTQVKETRRRTTLTSRRRTRSGDSPRSTMK